MDNSSITVALSPKANEQLKQAILFEHQNRIPEAMEAYRTLVELAPDCIGGWKKLGYLLNKMGESDAALRAYRTALTLNPADLITIRSLVIIYVKGNQVSEAEELLRVATADNKQEPGRGPLHLDLSQILLVQKRWDEAKMNLLDAILADSSSVGVYYNLAYLYSSLERWDDSLSICIKLLKMQHNHWNAYLLIHHVLNKTGRKQVADALYKRVATLRAKEEKMKGQWSEVVTETESDLKVPPFRFELFLPEEPNLR